MSTAVPPFEVGACGRCGAVISVTVDGQPGMDNGTVHAQWHEAWEAWMSRRRWRVRAWRRLTRTGFRLG